MSESELDNVVSIAKQKDRKTEKLEEAPAQPRPERPSLTVEEMQQAASDRKARQKVLRKEQNDRVKYNLGAKK